MHTNLARTIRTARLAAGLTQRQLGMRLGLQARAVYRWERDENAPTRRHRRALVAAFNGLDAKLVAELTAALAPTKTKKAGAAPVAAAPAPPPAPAISPAAAFELCMFRLADELDMPPRRVRTPLNRLLKRARAAGLTLEAMMQQLEVQIANAP